MRIDVNHPRAKHCQPYLDGEPVRYCIEADDEEGWIKRYKTDANGQMVVDPVASAQYGMLTTDLDYGLVIETLRGKVELVFNDAEEGQ